MPDSSGIPDAMQAPQPHHSVAGRIRTYFLTGLIVAGPIAITVWLIWSFVTWVDDLVRPFIPIAYRPETYLPVKVPGFGLIIAFLALTILGFTFAYLITGSVLVETIFSWPGIGSYAVDAARNLDYPAITGVTILGGIGFLIANLLTDIAYAAADPRMRGAAA